MKRLLDLIEAWRRRRRMVRHAAGLIAEWSGTRPGSSPKGRNQPPCEERT
jgi:hypothetical protein